MSMLDSLNQPLYTDTMLRDTEENRSEVNDVHLDVDNKPHVIGIIPHTTRENIPLSTIEALESFKVHSNLTIGNLIWSILVGLPISLVFFLLSIVFFVTVVGYRQGLYCLGMASYVIFPFGKYAYRDETLPQQDSIVANIAWKILTPIFAIPLVLCMGVSWELIYYIPMSKFLYKVLKQCYNNPGSVRFESLVNNNTQGGKFPLMMVQSSGSSFYFRFTFMSFEIIYMNLAPFVVLSLVCGFLAKEGTWLDDSLFGSIVAMVGAVPCAYMIGVCVDDLSHQLGLILGTIINASFITIVELILYYFSLVKGLSDIVRSAVTGAFLMNLLIIPGCSMLAAGIKWNEVVMNKRAQSISGTFLLLAIMSVLFPSVFYHAHATTHQDCRMCTADGDFTGNTTLNCTYCNSRSLSDLTKDPIYKKYAEPLMISMAAIMPVIYAIGVFFSLKTHAHIYEYKRAGDDEGEKSVTMTKTVAVGLLLFATVMFSLMAHVMTEKIPKAIDRLGFSERFVGLVFYTLIPNVAEYMNAIKFALNGNIGLAMEIGNQAAILTALIELPAVVLLSYIIHHATKTKLFTLVFPIIDVFCVLISVFLRNSILAEKSVNYFTGIAFLTIFLLISVVYFFDFF